MKHSSTMCFGKKHPAPQCKAGLKKGDNHTQQNYRLQAPVLAGQVLFGLSPQIIKLLFV
jgi:hypothetical protein